MSRPRAPSISHLVYRWTSTWGPGIEKVSPAPRSEGSRKGGTFLPINGRKAVVPRTQAVRIGRGLRRQMTLYLCYIKKKKKQAGSGYATCCAPSSLASVAARVVCASACMLSSPGLADSVWPHGREPPPPPPPRPWDFPGRNTGVGCHLLLQGIFPTQVSETRISYTGRRMLDHWATWESMETAVTFIKYWAALGKLASQYKVPASWRKVTFQADLFKLTFHV